MSMADRDGFIWYDDKLVLWRDTAAHVLTYSPQDGGSALEFVRCQAATRNAITAPPQDDEAPLRDTAGLVAEGAFFAGTAGHPTGVVRRRPVTQKRYAAIFDPVHARHARHTAGLTPI